MSLSGRAASFPVSVLVVDDELWVRKILEEVLTNRGLPVKVAASGEAAVELLEVEGFGCALVDKTLPGMDGLSVLRAVRRMYPYCACILMTAYASTESAVDALRLGAYDYLEKPFGDLTVLATKVEQALRTRQAAFDRDSLIGQRRALAADMAGYDPRLEPLLSSPADPGALPNKAAVLTHAQALLQHVKTLQANPKATLAEAQAAVSEIAQRLEAHVNLIKKVPGR
jgi:DNA-binding NtrC family response regulator